MSPQISIRLRRIAPLAALAAGALLCPPPPAGAAAKAAAHAQTPARAGAGFDQTPAALLKSAPGAAAFPTAGAVTLRDEETDTLHADGSCREEIHQTVQILNARGRGNADVSIAYNTSTQTVTDLRARTINPDGRVLAVKPADIHVSTPFAQYAMYDDAKYLSFSMPGVEDGAVVEYAYTRTTRRATLADQYSSDWTFQGGADPVRLSRLTIVAPAGMALNAQAHNTPGLTPRVWVSADGRRKTYVWQMQNLPEQTSEPNMPPGDTFHPWLEVSTVPSWQTIAAWYQALAAPRMAATPEITALVRRLTAGKTTDTDKAKALFYWVEGKTRYVALELGLSAFQPHGAGEVCTNRYGDCKDMATLLLCMMHEAGIKTAWPVLLGAGDKTPVRDRLASPSSFDHAIVRADLDGRPYWFDCTAELCPFGQIPGGDRGVDALVIRDGVGAFETIPVGGPDDNAISTTATVALRADGSADCASDLDATGDAALGMRAGLRSAPPDQIRQGMEATVRQASANATLVKYSFTPSDDRDAPERLHLEFHAPAFAQTAGSLLILPVAGMSTRDFDLPTRRYPFYRDAASHMSEDTVITLPAGYGVEDKPADQHLRTGMFQVDCTYSGTGGVLTVHQSIATLPGTLSPTDYVAVKAQVDALVAASRQPIVLHRLTPAKG